MSCENVCESEIRDERGEVAREWHGGIENRESLVALSEARLALDVCLDASRIRAAWKDPSRWNQRSILDNLTHSFTYTLRKSHWRVLIGWCHNGYTSILDFFVVFGHEWYRNGLSLLERCDGCEGRLRQASRLCGEGREPKWRSWYTNRWNSTYESFVPRSRESANRLKFQFVTDRVPGETSESKLQIPFLCSRYQRESDSLSLIIISLWWRQTLFHAQLIHLLSNLDRCN